MEDEPRVTSPVDWSFDNFVPTKRYVETSAAPSLEVLICLVFISVTFRLVQESHVIYMRLSPSVELIVPGVQCQRESVPIDMCFLLHVPEEPTGKPISGESPPR